MIIRTLSKKQQATWALKTQNKSLLKKLLYSGVRLITPPDESSPAFMAVCTGDIEIVSLVLHEAKCNPEETRNDDIPPLHKAVQEGYIDICQMLIKYGANLESKCRSGRTPVLHAAQFGKLNILKYLDELGADLNVDGDINVAT